MMDELLEQFLIEGRELVDQASDDLVALDRAPSDRGRIDSLFRAIHTLKGSVALFDFAPMGAMLHAAEDLLGELRAKKANVDRVMIDALLDCIEGSERWIAYIASHQRLPDSARQEGQALTAALVRAAQSQPEQAFEQQPVGAWLGDLLTGEEAMLATARTSGLAVHALRYEPPTDSYLTGYDPMLVARAIPDLLSFHVSLRERSPNDQSDPYACNLVIEALSSAPVEAIRAALGQALQHTIIVEDLLSSRTTPDASPVEPSDTPSDSSARTVRVDAERIDALVDLVGELIVAKNSLGHLAAQAGAGGLPFARNLDLAAAGFERLTADLHRMAMAMRMTPLARTFRRFPRWMRDTAAKLGKPVEFQVSDNGVEADKTIVDGIFEPLLHVLRNAIDHGLESSTQRAAAGKPLAGRITLEAKAQGDQFVLSVTDDGRGINVAAIRAGAKAKGLMSADAIDAVDDAAALDLIFLPGFSTAATVTDISGRGVGMHAVRSAITGLGGRVAMASTVGAGTTISMSLPQAILMSTVVTVDVGQERFGVPIDAVTETCRVPRERILPVRSGEAFVFRDRTLPLLRLASLLQVSSQRPPGEDAKVLIVRSGSHSVGVEVDGVGERLDVHMRPMSGLLAGMPGVMGTALLGDGRVLLVLDLPELAA